MQKQRVIIRAITSPDGLETIRGFWESHQRHPNSDFEHFRLVCDLRGEVLCPYVVVVERDSEPYALLAGRLERTHIVPSIGYFAPVRMRATVVRFVEGGLLGNLDEEGGKKLVYHAWSVLSAGKADVAIFEALHENAILKKVVIEDSPKFWTEGNPTWSKHWEMEIAGERDFLLRNMKSKHRNELGRMERKLASQFGSKISWRWISRFDDLTDLCARIEETAVDTYQRRLGAGFVNDTEHRERFALFARRGQLRMQLLEIAGKVKAFRIGVIYGGVYHGYGTGYDSKLADYRVGTLLFIRMVNELVQEGVYTLDFGLGDAHYKERFGNQSWLETNIRLFSPTLKGFMLKMTLSLFKVIDNAAHSLLRKTGLTDAMRSKIRALLVSRKSRGIES